MRDAFVRALVREMTECPRTVVVTGDLGFGVLRPVWENWPDRILNAGIAEQSMISLSAGLAMTGRKVIVYSIGNFPTIRPLEQIRNDCAYHGADVKIVCVGGGFVYGSLGMSHHATEDLAVMRAIPGVRVFAPGDPAEAEAVIPAALSAPGTCYLRIGRGNEPRAHQEPIIGWRMPEAILCRKGRDLALLSAGGILTEVAEAAEILSRQGLEAEVLSFPCVKPLDGKRVRETAKRFPLIVTVEEHNIMGGFGSAVCEEAAAEGAPCVIRRIGLSDTFTEVVGDQAYLREYYGISAKAIAEKAAAWIHEKRTDVG